MKALTDFSKIFLCRHLVDGRKQINSLAALVESDLGENPFNRSLYVFINKRRNQIKLLYFDETGFALWIKRLDRERFKWKPLPSDDKIMSLSHQKIDLLLQGIDIQKLKPHEPISCERFL